MHVSLSSRNITLAQTLSYAGTIPILIAIVAGYMHFESIDVFFMARCYLAVIISFICGIHWAIFMFFSSRCHYNMLLTSNAVSLFAWVTLLMPDITVALVMQSLCFLYLLMLDYRLKRAAVIPQWFYAMRHNATAIMVFCIVILEFAALQ